MAVKSDHVRFVSEIVFVIIYTQVEIPLFPHLFLVSSVLNFYLYFCFVLYCFLYMVGSVKCFNAWSNDQNWSKCRQTNKLI